MGTIDSIDEKLDAIKSLLLNIQELNIERLKLDYANYLSSMGLDPERAEKRFQQYYEFSQKKWD